LGFGVSLARPGGNLTGVVVGSDYGLWEKRFELLREVVPAVSTVTFLPVVRAWESFPYFRAVREAAQKVGISLTFVPFNSPFDEPEYRRVFATLGTERMRAIAINEGGNTFTHRRLIVQLIDELRVPAVYPFRDFVEAGGLMSYTVDLAGLFRHAARQVDQILKGAKPGDIPFYQATTSELIINLKTAKAHGLTIPPTLLARADEVVE
jgi:putative tryptophan/tyrosine transport system substrate-binding protein